MRLTQPLLPSAEREGSREPSAVAVERAAHAASPRLAATLRAKRLGCSPPGTRHGRFGSGGWMMCCQNRTT